MAHAEQNINFQGLRLFLKVAETSSFSETARLEHISRPALSRTIRLLQEHLGAKLFDRDTRHVHLTPSGAHLKPVAERLTAVRALPSVAAALLPPAIARFRARKPRVEFAVRAGLSGALLERLEERQIDFAVMSRPIGPAEFPVAGNRRLRLGLPRRSSIDGLRSRYVLIAYRPAVFEALRAQVTSERPAAHFDDLAATQVERFELPKLGG